jgi:hypothetical protein
MSVDEGYYSVLQAMLQADFKRAVENSARQANRLLRDIGTYGTSAMACQSSGSNLRTSDEVNELLRYSVEASKIAQAIAALQLLDEDAKRKNKEKK